MSGLSSHPFLAASEEFKNQTAKALKLLKKIDVKDIPYEANFGLVKQDGESSRYYNLLSLIEFLENFTWGKEIPKSFCFDIKTKSESGVKQTTEVTMPLDSHSVRTRLIDSVKVPLKNLDITTVIRQAARDMREFITLNPEQDSDHIKIAVAIDAIIEAFEQTNIVTLADDYMKTRDKKKSPNSEVFSQGDAVEFLIKQAKESLLA